MWLSSCATAADAVFDSKHNRMNNWYLLLFFMKITGKCIVYAVTLPLWNFNQATLGKILLYLVPYEYFKFWGYMCIFFFTVICVYFLLRYLTLFASLHPPPPKISILFYSVINFCFKFITCFSFLFHFFSTLHIFFCILTFSINHYFSIFLIFIFLS